MNNLPPKAERQKHAPRNGVTSAASILVHGFLLCLAGTEPTLAPASPAAAVVSEPLTPGHRVSTKPLDLSRAPSVDELAAAGQLGGPLFPTHELDDPVRDEAARWAFGKIIEQW